MAKVDTVTVEVVRNALVSAAREMSTALVRTAYSPIVYEVRDFSNVILDASANLVAQAEGIPFFLGVMHLPLVKTIEKFGLENIHPDDVIITNDPYVGGGTHLNDINLLEPIFYDDEPVLFSETKVHWLDVQGKDPGSWSADATEIYQEGIRLAPMKLFDEGKPNEALMDVIRYNVRLGEASMGDIRAGVAAIHTGKRRVEELLKRRGWKTVQACIEEMMNHGERMVRLELNKVPDGVFEGEGYLDSDGIEDKLIKVKLKIAVKGSDATFDFTGSDPQVRGACGNAPLGSTISGVRIAMKCLLIPHLEANEGCYRPFKVIAPESTVVNCTSPAPCTIGTGHIARVIIDLIWRLLAEELPERSIGEHYGTLAIFSARGVDPRTGKFFSFLMPYGGGWGGRATKDGVSALVCIINGDNYNVPAEVIEAKYPMRVEAYELRKDSGGPGKYRGGLGIISEYTMLSDASAFVTFDRYKEETSPLGVFGGKPGMTNTLRINPGTDEEKAVHMVTGLPVKEGTHISHRTGGGGGYGDPLERDVELVLKDVINDYISIDSARDDYGVVIDPKSLEVDKAATDKLRKEIRGKR